MRRVTLLVAISAFSAVGCDRDPSDKIDKSLHSWSATIELMSRQLDDSAVTKTYAQQLAKSASEELDDLAKEVKDASKRGELEERLRQVRQDADGLQKRSTSAERRS